MSRKKISWNIVLHFIILFIIDLQHPAAAQHTDSLQQALAVYMKSDTIRANTLIALAIDLYRTGQVERAIITADSARALCRKLGYAKGEGRAWLASGYALYRKNNYQEALKHYKSAYSIFINLQDRSELARTYLYMGQVYDFLSDYNKALKSYSHALDLIKDEPFSRNKASLLNSIGITYFNKGNYEIAIDYYYKALEISESLQEKRLTSSVLINLGAANERLEQYEDALIFYQRTLAIASTMGNRSSLSLTKANIGGIYVLLKRYEEAEQELRQALQIQEDIHDRRGMIYSLSNRGNLHNAMHKPRKAEADFLRAINISREIEDSESLLNPGLGLAGLYIRQRRYKEAQYYLELTRRISKEIGTRYWLEQNYLVSSQLDSALQNFQGALQWFKAYSTLKDSLFNRIKTEQISQIKEQYESEKKDNEIKLLSESRRNEEESKTFREKIFMASLIIVALIISSLVYIAQVKTRTARLLKQQKDAIARSNEELKVLLDLNLRQREALALQNEKLEDLHIEKNGFISIIAHDLRSPLHKAAGLAGIIPLSGPINSDQKEIIDRITKVCDDGNTLINDLLEMDSLESPGRNVQYSVIDLRSFINNVVNHFEAQLRRKNIQLEVHYVEDEEIFFNTDVHDLGRIIDNLISNAIKFSCRGTAIKLIVTQSEDTLSLSIHDNGQGIRQEEMPHLFKKFKKLSARPTEGETSTGLGLSIVKLLTEKLKGTITVKSIWGGGTTFTLSFPHKQHHKQQVSRC